MVSFAWMGQFIMIFARVSNTASCTFPLHFQCFISLSSAIMAVSHLMSPGTVRTYVLYSCNLLSECNVSPLSLILSYTSSLVNEAACFEEEKLLLATH